MDRHVCNLVADPSRNCLEKTIRFGGVPAGSFFGRGMEPSPALPIALLGRGAFAAKSADQDHHGPSSGGAFL